MPPLATLNDEGSATSIPSRCANICRSPYGAAFAIGRTGTHSSIVGAFYLRKISGSFAMLADPPRLVLREQLGRRASPRLILVNRPIVPRRRRRYSHEKAAIKSR